MRIELLFPPPWNLSSVIYLALPTLSAYLRQHGVDVVQRDINLRVCQILLQPEQLREAKSEIKRILQKIEVQGTQKPYASWFVRQLQICWGIADYTMNNIESAIQTLKTEAHDRRAIRRSVDIITSACMILSAPYYPTVWNYNYYRYDNQVASRLDTVFACVFEDKSNLFLKPYQEQVIPEVLKQGSKIFGICLAFIDQMIPGLTLARVIKEQCSEAIIIIGGPLMPYIQKALSHFSPIFSIIDFAILGEGEVPLLQLLRELDSERKFHLVPGLIYKTAEGAIVQTAPNVEINIRESPLPDFDSYHLDQYWTAVRSLPYLSERGCYWRKCAFCSINSTYGRSFRSKPIAQVVEELKALKQRYACKLFEFSDEAMSPARMRRLSKALIESGLEIYWFTLARVEKQFSAELFRLAYRAGCRVISWGIESGSQRVLDRMNKHVKVEDALRVLRESHEGGIWNNVFIMLGFPGETDDDVEQTIAFINQGNEYIHSIVYGPFRLEKCTAIFESPEKFGIKIKPYPLTYCRPDYEYWEEETGKASQGKERLQYFEAFITGLPCNYLPFYTLGQLINALVASPNAKVELRASQQRRAELQARIQEIIRSPQQWWVEVSPTVCWRDVEDLSNKSNGESLCLGINPKTGGVVVLSRKLMQIFTNAQRFRQALIRSQVIREERGERERATQFLELAETVLKVLPFSASRIEDQP